ncbi:MAG: thiolase family protein [Candidatus Zixiibacteriota bacterium]|nr:MAG: thiolase family protein [candidate division Zixibacteria bacterium]
MAFSKSYIPYGGYWSSPYAKWQGSFANMHALELAAGTAGKFFENRKISPDKFDNLYLGQTIPQLQCFYGGPWIAGMLGNGNITGPVINQACITGVVCVKLASQDIEDGIAGTSLIVAADRCSNGPHLYYPSQTGPGALGQTEDWVWDNFGRDPWAKGSMIQTAENVAKANNITREEQDDVAQRRFEQYQSALADNGAFHKKYMIPVEVGKGKRAKLIETDEGVFPTTREGLSGLRPMLPEGTVTFGSQTHPADGNSGMIVTTKEKAAELSANSKIEIQFVGFGTARVKKGFMAEAVVPATKAALKDAGIEISDIKAVNTHNPFAVNDIYFSREMGFNVNNMNNFGSSIIWGHPQGPTALRALIELIEELAAKGGGYGLFGGCAAGDTAAGCVLKVTG